MGRCVVWAQNFHCEGTLRHLVEKERELAQGVLAHLETTVNGVESTLRSLRKTKRSLERMITRGEPLTYRVKLISLWAQEGEKSAEVEGTKPLKEIFDEVIKEFLKINSRSDVQASYVVKAVVGSQALPVDKKYWQEYEWKKPAV